MTSGRVHPAYTALYRASVDWMVDPPLSSLPYSLFRVFDTNEMAAGSDETQDDEDDDVDDGDDDDDDRANSQDNQ